MRPSCCAILQLGLLIFQFVADAGSIAEATGVRLSEVGQNSELSGKGQEQHGSGDVENATQRLFDALLTTFVVVFLGLVVVRLNLISPEKGEMKGLGFLIGQIVFPLLVFKTVATARLGNIDWGVPLACSFGKLIVMMVTWISTFLFYQFKKPLGQRFLNATVFASYVMASNDFAIGFPVVQALYGNDIDMGIYIAGNSVIGSMVFVPAIMVLFSIGKALDRTTDGASLERGTGSSNKASVFLLLFHDILANPVILMTIAGLLYKLLLGQTLHEEGKTYKFPHPFSDTVDLVIRPFGMCALFLTGTSLKSLRMSLVPLLLVIMKVVVSAYVTYFLGEVLCSDELLINFTFLYGMIPSSSAPLIFATSFAPDASALIATSILLGLILAGPFMYATAIFLESERIDKTATLAGVHYACSSIGLLAGACFAVILFAMGSEWGFKCPIKALVALYGLVLMAYEALLFVVSPQVDSRHCVDYNKTGGWAPIGIAICWIQNVGQFLVFAVQLVTIQLHRNAGEPVAKSVAALVFFGLFFSIIPSLMTFPSTINELCADVRPPLGNISLTGNMFWTAGGLFSTIALYIFGRCNKRRNPNNDSDDERGPRLAGGEDDDTFVHNEVVDGAVEVASFWAKHVSEGKSWKTSIPINLVRGLFFLQAFRLLLQFVNTYLVMQDTQIMGSFAQMLILEHAVVELQPLIFFVMLFGSRSFTSHAARIIPNRICCVGQDECGLMAPIIVPSCPQEHLLDDETAINNNGLLRGHTIASIIGGSLRGYGSEGGDISDDSEESADYEGAA